MRCKIYLYSVFCNTELKLDLCSDRTLMSDKYRWITTRAWNGTSKAISYIYIYTSQMDFRNNMTVYYTVYLEYDREVIYDRLKTTHLGTLYIAAYSGYISTRYSGFVTLTVI